MLRRSRQGISSGVRISNYQRGDTVAAIDRFRKIAANLKATVVIQHDARDVGKLPVFPATPNPVCPPARTSSATSNGTITRPYRKVSASKQFAAASEIRGVVLMTIERSGICRI